jgi:hypothetical protein
MYRHNSKKLARSKLLLWETSYADRCHSTNHSNGNPWTEIANFSSFGGMLLLTDHVTMISTMVLYIENATIELLYRQNRSNNNACERLRIRLYKPKINLLFDILLFCE